jgi:hypothetical protein
LLAFFKRGREEKKINHDHVRSEAVVEVSATEWRLECFQKEYTVHYKLISGEIRGG